MVNRYSEILLPSDPPFPCYLCEDEHILRPLSLVNLFVGANNSGKSRLLRNLFACKNLGYASKDCNAGECYALAKDTQDQLDGVFGSNVDSVGPVSAKPLSGILALNSRFILPGHTIYEQLKTELPRLLDAAGGNVSFSGTRPNGEVLAKRIRGIGLEALERFGAIKFNSDIGDEKRYYVPVLRGMRPFDADHTNRYKDRTIADYFPKERALPGSSEIFTGLELYQILKRKLLGEPEAREEVRRFENLLSVQFFSSRPVTLIPYEGDTTVRIKIGEEKQLPIYNLGDGMQNLIICTFNVVTESNRCLFFFEEPDMCMHPSMQRSFLDVLTQFPQHQYFITTHSNHFLDMTLDFSDISVFHFAKVHGAEPQFRMHAVSTGDQNLLRDLGVRNSSVFLTNATVWVEGITDRLYLRRYLQKYCELVERDDPAKAASLKNVREDLHYSFMEYQGSNLEHWGFEEDASSRRIRADYVCAHAFLIADGDIASKGDREQEYRNMLGDRFHTFPGKEMENLIPVEVLRRVVSKEFEEHGIDVNCIQYVDYAEKMMGLGAYLDGLLGLAPGTSVFAAASGTVKNKLRFCDRVLRVMNDPNVQWTLPPELEDLCAKVFDHISAQNDGLV